MATTLYRENIYLGGDVGVELHPDHVRIIGAGRATSFVPRNRQEANRLAIALKKASNRLEAIGLTLPDEPR